MTQFPIGPVALGTVLAAAACASIAAEAEQPVEAIWKTQEISFYFQSFTTFYSCTGLEDKLERVLRALGVRAQAQVRSADCPSAVARMPRVILKVTSPVEATPAAIAARDRLLEEDKSRRELAARVRNERPDDTDQLAKFPAQWRRISLSRGQLDLQPGDCELIDELRRKVLPKLAIKIVENELQCTPHQLSPGQPRLEVEALIETPKADDKADEAPPPG